MGLGVNEGPNLALVLTFSPFLFLVGQFMISRIPFLLSCSKRAWRLLLSSAFLQAAMLPIAILLPHTITGAVVICLIGGFAAAAIYPSMQALLTTYQKSLPSHSRNGIQICASASADIGQLLGAMVFGLGNAANWAAWMMMALALGLAGIVVGSFWKSNRRRIFPS